MNRHSILFIACMLFIPFFGIKIRAYPLGSVDDFTYQLQGYEGLSELTESLFDLVIMDYSSDGGEEGEFSAHDIQYIRSGGGCGDRIVLGYFSVGEAEDYRFYWKAWWDDEAPFGIPDADAPEWLGPSNPEWPGNYKVRFWHEGWREILYGTSSGPNKSYLDRIMDQGFDGVYLDVVDAYEYWGPHEIGGNDANRQSPADMVRLVRDISHYAQMTKGINNFLVLPQNGAGIISPDSYPDASDPGLEASVQRSVYFYAIDGIGSEDTFFYGPDDENNDYCPQWDVIELLEQFRAADKPVLAVEYLTEPAKISVFYDQFAPSCSFIPYATVRELDRMTVNQGYEPDCDPGASPTPAPSPTPMHREEGFYIKLSDDSFTAYDSFILECRSLIRSGQTVDQYIALEAFNVFFFWPSWNEEADFRRLQLTPGFSDWESVLDFTWPDAAGAAGGLKFYSAMFQQESFVLIGELQVIEWDYY